MNNLLAASDPAAGRRTGIASQQAAQRQAQEGFGQAAGPSLVWGRVDRTEEVTTCWAPGDRQFQGNEALYRQLREPGMDSLRRQNRKF